MVGSWGRLEVGSAPSSNLVRRWGKNCGQKMGQPGLKTGAPSSNQGLVGRWGRPVLRLGRSEDGAQHIQIICNLFLPAHGLLFFPTRHPLLCLAYAHHSQGYNISLIMLSS